MSVIEDFKQLLTIKRYSPRTIETYTNALRQFLTFFHPKSPETIDVKEIEAFKASRLQATAFQHRIKSNSSVPSSFFTMKSIVEISRLITSILTAPRSKFPSC